MGSVNVREGGGGGVWVSGERVWGVGCVSWEGLKGLRMGKKVKEGRKGIKMCVNVIGLIEGNMKEKREKVKYKKGKEGEEVKEE